MKPSNQAGHKTRPVALIIDDDPYLAKVLCSALQINNFKCFTTPTGAGGLEAVTKRHTDIVLLDLLLPDIDGFEVISRMKQVSDVPILVMTALPETRNKVKALGLGAADYLSKPFDLDELLARVMAVVQGSE